MQAGSLCYFCRQTNSVANKAYLNGQTTDFYKILRLPTIPYFGRTLPNFSLILNRVKVTQASSLHCVSSSCCIEITCRYSEVQAGSLCYFCRQTNSVANKAYLNGQTTDFYKILRLPTIPYFGRTLPNFSLILNRVKVTQASSLHCVSSSCCIEITCRYSEVQAGSLCYFFSKNEFHLILGISGIFCVKITGIFEIPLIYALLNEIKP